MILSRAPLRVSLMGGGSDLPSFYRRHGGRVVSFAIDKFVYVACNPSFYDRYRFVYRNIEEFDEPDQIKHPILREVLRDFPVPPMDFMSYADIPAGTGLASSSAFTAAATLSLSAFHRADFAASELAEYCCDIEIGRLGEPIGKQDQYAAAFGGLNVLHFANDDTVTVEPLDVPDFAAFVERHVTLIFTGMTRRANRILAEVNQSFATADAKVEAQREMVAMVDDMCAALRRGDAPACGRLLHESWLLKRSLSPNIATPAVSDLYDLMIERGAYGGKLLGAGGGGFVAVVHPEGFRERLNDGDGRLLPFRFHSRGAEQVYNDIR